jgi:hypothetical protein
MSRTGLAIIDFSFSGGNLSVKYLNYHSKFFQYFPLICTAATESLHFKGRILSLFFEPIFIQGTNFLKKTAHNHYAQVIGIFAEKNKNGGSRHG